MNAIEEACKRLEAFDNGLTTTQQQLTADIRIVITAARQADFCKGVLDATKWLDPICNLQGCQSLVWKHKCEQAEAECLEQARLLGMSGERECALLAERDTLRHKLNQWEARILERDDLKGRAETLGD